MQIEKYLEILLLMDRLITGEKTGPPGSFARKLQLSERQTRTYIGYLRKKGAPVTYCRRRRSYVYAGNGRFHIEFAYKKEERYADP